MTGLKETEPVTAAATRLEAPPAMDVARRVASVVAAAGVCLTLDDRHILQDIELEVPAGGTVALLGANGAGKSTLLKVLATLLRPSAGRLRLFGGDVGPHAAKLRSRIGLISHQPMLYRDLSVLENLVFFGRLYGVPGPRERAEALLEHVGMAHRADDAVKTLSRGLTQRAAIARALMHDPDLLLADEPFDGLDAGSAAALEALLTRLRAGGKTLILSNHDIRQALALTDRTVVLRRGRVVLDRPSRELTPDAVLKEIVGP